MPSPENVTATTIRLNVNSAPFQLFAKFFESVLEISKTAINFADFPSELIRVESMSDTASTGEFGIILYPSDAFLVFAATVAGNLDFNIINKSGHGYSPSVQ